MRRIAVVMLATGLAAVGLAILGGPGAQASNCTDADLADVHGELNTAADGFESEDSISGTNGGPFPATLRGLAEACRQDNPGPAVCGVLAGVDNMSAGASADVTNAVREAAEAAGIPCTTTTTTTTTHPPRPTTSTTVTPVCFCGGPSPTVAGEVIAQSAGADGTLPRTGTGTLVAALGFGLTSLGVLVRRFIR
jgi:hypothetical protein